MVLSFDKRVSTKPDANLRSVFKPLYITLSILGLFPYSVKLQSVKPAFTAIPKSIYLNIMCTMFYSVIMVLFLVLHVRQITLALEDSPFTEAIMTQFNYILELLTLLSFCAVAYIRVYLDRSKYVNTLNILTNLIETSEINKEKVLRSLRFQVNFVVVGSLIILILLQTAVNYTRSDSFYKKILVTITFNLPQTLQFTSIAVFHFLVMAVVEILRSVREEILYTSTLKEKITTNCLTTVVSRRGNLTLRKVELICIEAFRVKQNVNRMFEAPILVMLMQCFHAIVSESHIIFHGVVIQMDLDTHNIVNCSIWIFYQVLKVYVVAKAGNVFKLETLRLQKAIHKIPTEKQDLCFFMEVQHLSSLMSLPGKDLTVYGYFALDSSLLFKVIASAVMYVIILVQFDKKC